MSSKIGKKRFCRKENLKHETNQRNLGLSARTVNSIKRQHIELNPLLIAGHVHTLCVARGVGEKTLKEIGEMLLLRGVINNIDEWIEDGRQRNRRS